MQLGGLFVLTAPIMGLGQQRVIQELLDQSKGDGAPT
jgi:hypothetical protein